MVLFKNETTNFNGDIDNINHFNSFYYNAKLLENTKADRNNRIVKNFVIAVPLKYQSNF